MRKQFAASSGLLRVTVQLKFDDLSLSLHYSPDWAFQADVSSTLAGQTVGTVPLHPHDEQMLGDLFRRGIEASILYAMEYAMEHAMEPMIDALEEQLKDQYTAARVQGWRPFP